MGVVRYTLLMSGTENGRKCVIKSFIDLAATNLSFTISYTYYLVYFKILSYFSLPKHTVKLVFDQTWAMAETQSLAGILAAVALPNLGGITGGYFAKKAGKNYSRSLKRPWYTPPDWVYGPVWAGLCSGIGYASYLVYKDGGGFDGE